MATDAASVRDAFASFLGEERFLKFIKTYNQPVRPYNVGRMRFWQEREWNRFTAKFPQFLMCYDELAAVLRICYLHGDELLPGLADVFHGCVDFSPEHYEVVRRLFPHAADFFSTEGTEFQGDQKEVFYCPKCRLAKQEWTNRKNRRTR